MKLNEKAKQIENKTKEKYTVVNYTGSEETIEYLHYACNRTFSLKSRTNKLTCPYCRNEGQSKKLKEKILVENIPYELVGEYINGDTKTEFRHLDCGLTSFFKPYRIKTHKCTKCVNGKPKTEILQEELNKEFGEKTYKLSYFNKRTDFGVIHKCGFELKKRTLDKLRRYNCPKCEGGFNYYTTESYEKEFYKIYSRDEYKLVKGFVKCSEHITTFHYKCGREYNIYPHKALEYGRCGACIMEEKKFERTAEGFLQKLYKTVDGKEYELISDYKGSQNKLTLRHKNCGYTFQATPANILSGTRCRKCSKSKGEKAIEYYLESNGYKFIDEYTFENCVNPKTNKKLRFDFGIIDSKNELQFLIEYDGIQHFKPIKHFGGKIAFVNRKYLDSLKTDFCKNNNIPLIRIKYTEFNNLEVRLKEKLPVISV